MKKIFLSLSFLMIIYTATPQVPEYDLSSVPENVKKNASVIKRSENIVFEIKDIDRAYLNVDKVVTVTNANGKNELIFREYSNKFIELTEAEIKVYDAAGKSIGKYKKSDMNTTANGDGLIDEGKMTYFIVTAAAYPITVEYKYEVKYKGTLFYPDYEILGSAEGVENSSFTVKVPKELDLRYKEKNIKLTPEVITDDKNKTYKWSVKNLSPIEFEEGSVSYEGRYPTILLAPNHFKLYDYEGDMTSWKQFGNWENGLIQGLNVLPDDRKAFFTDLVKDARDEKEKIKLVYQYLQKNFRYVSIQLGIGGYKPFPASFTDQKKYGDCKGLSFYTHAVLNAIGIKSYVALINAEYNKEPVDPNFPCNQFNHMILCVPQKKDTIWLECTSNTNDFAVLGNFTENKYALLITENGGVLVPTPKSKSSDNTFNAFTKIIIADDASGKCTTTLQTSGEYSQDLMHYVFEENKDDQKKFIVNYYGFKQPDEFSIEKKQTDNNFTTSLSLSIEKIPEFVAGSKMFISPRLYKIWSHKLPKAENRRLDYYFQGPFEKTDTTVFKLPEGYTSDALPSAKNLKCDYAVYSTRYWYNETEKAVYSTAKLVLLQHKIPAANYAVAKSFFDDVLKDDTQRIVIKKE
jgi:Domain of Unknown Function with PDB structure (DUF3857)